MTAASHWISRQRRSYPLPSDATDRTLALYRRLQFGLPPALSDLVKDGTVTIGELGRNVPDCGMVPVGDGAAIVITSGMIDFVRAVLRALAGNMVKVTSDGPQNAAALSVPDVARLAAGLFKEWTWPKRWLWSIRRTAPPDLAITKGVHRTVEERAFFAALFLLAHELGHVAIDRGIVERANPNRELVADAVGLELLLKADRINEIDPTLTFAGAVVAVRIVASLENVGVKFLGDYPAATKRIECLWSTMRAVCPSMQYFREIARLAVAYEDQMCDVDKLINKRSRAVPQDIDRVLVRLIAMLLEVGMERLSMEGFITKASAATTRASPDVRHEAIHTLQQYYVGEPTEPTFIDPTMRKRMGRVVSAMTSQRLWAL